MIRKTFYPLLLIGLVVQLLGCSMTGDITSLDSLSTKSPAEPSNKTSAVYFQAQPVVFSVTTGSVATVTGAPRISLMVGGTQRFANYTTGSGTTNLSFVYTPEAGDYDATGAVVSSAVDLNGGAILDSNGISLVASMVISAPVTNILVDAIPHQVSFTQGASSSAVAESSGTQILSFSMSPAALGAIVVPLTRSGTAVAGVDDDLQSLTIAIPAGATSVSASFQVLASSPSVGDRILQLQLGRPVTTGANVMLGTADQYQMLIRDEAPSLKSMAMVAVGYYHTCGVVAGTGSLLCWGANNYGQVGDGTNIQRNAPTPIDLGTSYSTVSLGVDFGCAIVAVSGELKCWGYNLNGQLGDGTSTQRNSPTLIDSGVAYSQIAAGGIHSCGIVAGSGVLKCWGGNSEGQLGDGTTTQRNSPTIVDAGTSYSKIAAMASHTCGIVAGTGAVKCWGRNSSGQLGDGTTTSRLTPTNIDPGVAYSQIAVGGIHSCGIVAGSGVLKCWGSNASSQLGDGGSSDSLTPTVADPGVSYSAIGGASNNTCGIVAFTGALKCWGDNSYGQLGDGTNTFRQVPTAIDTGVTYSQIALFSQHACGVLAATGALKCWGFNFYGQLGDQNPMVQPLPLAVDAPESYQKISIGSGLACGILVGGGLKCWGSNTVGQLGDGTTVNRYAPTLIDIGVAYSEVASGGTFGCGITTLGALKCWGNNSGGRLGDGTTTNRLTPITIDPGFTYSQITAGSSHSCGIVAGSGVLKCWGYNVSGQLGDGTTVTRLTPVVVDSGVSYSLVKAGSSHTCGIVAASGAIKCWGSNSRGQLGDGTSTPSNLPVLVDSGVAYAQIATGYDISCGIVAGSGALKCWGRNFYGQLGDGTSTNRNLPTLIDPGTAYSQIKTSSAASTCGIVAGSGVLKCWGQNYYGEVGDGTTDQRSLPVVSTVGVIFSQVATGGGTTCGIVAGTGALKCWGSNSAGQLGASPLRFGLPAYVPL